MFLPHPHCQPPPYPLNLYCHISYVHCCPLLSLLSGLSSSSPYCETLTKILGQIDHAQSKIAQCVQHVDILFYFFCAHTSGLPFHAGSTSVSKNSQHPPRITSSPIIRTSSYQQPHSVSPSYHRLITTAQKIF